MAHGPAQFIITRSRGARTLAALGASLLLTACAGTSDMLPSSPYLASNDTKADAAADSTSELQKAVDYWGKQYKAKPTDKTAALSYAKNLKAAGDKRQALSVLQNAAGYNDTDPEIMSELGRLALEFDQLQTAARALEIADRGNKPDWKVLSARGTVLAKQGQHKAAIPFFERALTLAPNQPSVMNNLAMAHAMSGDAAKAEEILRQVATKDGAPAKVNQNLALVLGLQGKYEESKVAGTAAAGSSTIATENTDYLRRMVRLEAKKPAVAAPVATVAAAAPLPATANATAPSSAPLPWAQKTAVAPAATAVAPQANATTGKVAAVNDAFKPGSIENTSNIGWQTAVTANAQPAKGTAPQGAPR